MVAFDAGMAQIADDLREGKGAGIGTGCAGSMTVLISSCMGISYSVGTVFKL